MHQPLSSQKSAFCILQLDIMMYHMIFWQIYQLLQNPCEVKVKVKVNFIIPQEETPVALHVFPTYMNNTQNIT